MGELKKLLEPVANGAGRDHDPYGALERRRARRARNKRLRAGVLAIVIAAGGTLFALRALGGGDAAAPLEPGPRGAAFGVWPEQMLEQASAVQGQADAGDPDAQWRLDPSAVAERFGTDALGWEGVSVAPGTVAYGGTVEVSIAAAPVECPTPADGEPLPPACLPRTASLSLAQLVRSGDGGIWSVTAIDSDLVELDTSALSSAEPGSRIPVSYDAPAGTTAILGISDTEGNCQVTPLEGSGTFDLRVGDCGNPAIAWGAIRIGTLDEIVRDGIPGDEWGSPFDLKGVLAFAATPLDQTSVTSEPSVLPTSVATPTASEEPGVGAAPDVLEATCANDGTTTIASDRVRVQDDGVHVRVEGNGDRFSFYATLEGRDAGRFDTFSMALSGAVTEFVTTYPPGPIFVGCVGDGNGGQPSQDLTRVEILDPQGIWISDELTCPTSDQVQAEGFRAISGALSMSEPSPEAAIRLHVPGVLDTDEVLLAEYGRDPNHPNEQAWMVVRRDGRVVARFQMDGHDGVWGVHWGDTCKGSGVADSGNMPLA